MKLVRKPEPDVDLDAVGARLRLTPNEPITETVLDSLVDIPGLVAEIRRLLRIEEATRREFAELLAAVRAVLPTLDSDYTDQAMKLRALADLHREIAPEELDQWSGAGTPGACQSLTLTERRR
jgi:hypothetical protein